MQANTPLIRLEKAPPNQNHPNETLRKDGLTEQNHIGSFPLNFINNQYSLYDMKYATLLNTIYFIDKIYTNFYL